MSNKILRNKIPCGGFYLDDMLNVNDSGELSIKGGTPYQQLVTDGDGNTRWENKMIVDSELSETSENPVQNKVIKSALDAKQSKNFTITFTQGSDGKYTADKTFGELSAAISEGASIFAAVKSENSPLEGYSMLSQFVEGSKASFSSYQVIPGYGVGFTTFYIAADNSVNTESATISLA